MATKKKFAPPPMNEKGEVQPLKHNALVRLKVKFRGADGVTYEPSRFGVQVPKGTILPKSAEIVDDDYRGRDMDLVSTVPKQALPSTLPDSEGKTSLTMDTAETKEDEKALKEQQKMGNKLKLS